MNCIYWKLTFFVDRSKIPLESMVQRVLSIGNSDSIIWSGELFALLFFSRNCFSFSQSRRQLHCMAHVVCKTSAAAAAKIVFAPSSTSSQSDFPEDRRSKNRLKTQRIGKRCESSSYWFFSWTYKEQNLICPLKKCTRVGATFQIKGPP